MEIAKFLVFVLTSCFALNSISLTQFAGFLTKLLPLCLLVSHLFLFVVVVLLIPFRQYFSPFWFQYSLLVQFVVQLLILDGMGT